MDKALCGHVCVTLMYVNYPEIFRFLLLCEGCITERILSRSDGAVYAD